MKGGPARTDRPSPRAALPTLARQGIWGVRDLKVSQTARPGQAGLETLSPHRGRKGAQEALRGPTSSPLTHVPIPTLVVSTVTLQGQPPLGSGRDGPQPPFSPHPTL